MKALIIKRIENGILHISLNRPSKLNALTVDMLAELSETFDQCKYDPSIKSIFMTGEGKGFCAGADLDEISKLNNCMLKEYSLFGQKTFRKLELLGKPSLSAVHGFAHGGGCELSMASSIRISTTDSIFSQPEIKLDIIPAFGGTQRLSQLIGKGRALRLCLTGGKFTAEQALKWGFLGQTTSNEELVPTAIEILNKLGKLSPSAIESILHLFNDNHSFEQGPKLEAIHFERLISSVNGKYKINSFLNRNKE